MQNMQTTWKQALKTLALCWRPILLTHFAFSVLGVALFTPLIGLTSRVLLKLSGQTALADQDIAYFLLSPIGLFALIIFTALLIAILAFEQAAVMHIALRSAHDEKVGPIDALFYIAARSHKLWLFTARLVIRVLILCLPLLAIAALIAKYLVSDYDINFYLTEKPPEFWVAGTLIGAVLLLLIVLLVRKLLQWSMTLPLLLFADVSPANSFAESSRIVEGQRKHIFMVLISWAVLSLVLGISLVGALKLVGAWAIPAVSESLALMVILLGGLAAIWSITNILITALTSGSFACLLLTLYQHYGPDLPPLERQLPPKSGRSPTITANTLVAVTGIVAVVATVAGILLLNGIPTNNQTIIVAHRGAAGKAPENTLASFQQAIDDQTDWIELDVQENAQDEIVVIHDSDFMKLAGNPVKIRDATSAQIKEIDIGSWFDPKFSAERAPTLEQVLELARGRAKVVIELKYYGHDQNLEQRVIDIVERADMVNETALMSLKYKAVQKVRGLRPDWNIGLLSATAIGDLSQLDTDFLAVAMGMASAGFIDRAQKAGRKVFVWTVNDPVSMSRMISLGVDGIITDEPAMARRVLAERANLSTTQRLLLHVAQLFGEPYIPGEYRDSSP